MSSRGLQRVLGLVEPDSGDRIDRAGLIEDLTEPQQLLVKQQPDPLGQIRPGPDQQLGRLGSPNSATSVSALNGPASRLAADEYEPRPDDCMPDIIAFPSGVPRGVRGVTPPDDNCTRRSCHVLTARETRSGRSADERSKAPCLPADWAAVSVPNADSNSRLARSSRTRPASAAASSAAPPGLSRQTRATCSAARSATDTTRDWSAARRAESSAAYRAAPASARARLPPRRPGAMARFPRSALPRSPLAT